MPITLSRKTPRRRNNAQTTRWWHCFVATTDASHSSHSQTLSPPPHNFVPARPPPTLHPVPLNFTSEYAERLHDDLRFRSPTEVNNNAISTVKITETHKRIELHCPICREEYKVGEEADQLPCNHIFHSACVDSWLNLHKTCPVCRRRVKNMVGDQSEIHGFDPEEDIATPRSVVIVIE